MAVHAYFQRQPVRISGNGFLPSFFVKLGLCIALIWPLSAVHVRAEPEPAPVTDNLDALTTKLVQTAMLIQSREQEVLDSEIRLDELKLRRRSMMARFDRQRSELSQMLAALQRLGRQPPALLLARADAAVDHVRGATLLGAVVKNIEKDAAVLREDLAEIDRLESVMTEERQVLLSHLEDLRGEQAQLNALLAEQNGQNAGLIEAAAQNAAAMKVLAQKAKDAGDLLARLEPDASAPGADAAIPRSKPSAPAEETAQETEEQVAVLSPPPAIADAAVPISAAKGRLSMPARGKIVADFGAKDNTGATRRGLSIRTRENAEIVAPFGGRIVFAGPFRAYGQLLILEAGEGYHILLSGMSQVHGVIGQSVAQGQPVGRMGTGPKSDGQAGPDQGAELRDLYVEFRKDGKPFNPMPWLEINANKVSG